MSKAILGKKDVQGNAVFDITDLLETRLLVQANSGGGKSWVLRRLMEQTANKVQQIIIDPEGEFSSLREKFDYVICAPHDGDAIAHPRTAGLLAKRLLETGVSAVIDIYDLKSHERKAFVRLFLDSMVNAHKKLWRPVLVVLDEAHIFAPEKGKAESTGSVIDIATRGRKRGQCLIVATQRIAKLHKDVAAECLNKVIGRTGLDIDVKRAADELGMTAKEAMPILRNLEPGEFFVFGPAISREVVSMKVGPVFTTHPKAGKRLMKAPPAPSTKVKKILSKLSDLPKEAEREARTVAELKAELKKARSELTIAKKHGVKIGIPETEIKKRINMAVAVVLKEVKALEKEKKEFIYAVTQINRAAIIILNKQDQDIIKVEGSQTLLLPPVEIPAKQIRQSQKYLEDASGIKLRAGAVRILKELASRYPAGYSKPQVGILSGFSHKGGTFSTYLSDLRRSGYVEEINGLLHATEEGVREIGDDLPATPKNHGEVMAQWRRALRSGAYRILETIVNAGHGGIEKEVIAELVGMVVTGGTFSTYLSDLRRNGLVTQSGNTFVACDILYP